MNFDQIPTGMEAEPTIVNIETDKDEPETLPEKKIIEENVEAKANMENRFKERLDNLLLEESALSKHSDLSSADIHNIISFFNSGMDIENSSILNDELRKRIFSGNINNETMDKLKKLAAEKMQLSTFLYERKRAYQDLSEEQNNQNNENKLSMLNAIITAQDYFEDHFYKLDEEKNKLLSLQSHTEETQKIDYAQMRLNELYHAITFKINSGQKDAPLSKDQIAQFLNIDKYL